MPFKRFNCPTCGKPTNTLSAIVLDAGSTLALIECMACPEMISATVEIPNTNTAEYGISGELVDESVQ